MRNANEIAQCELFGSSLNLKQQNCTVLSKPGATGGSNNKAELHAAQENYLSIRSE